MPRTHGDWSDLHTCEGLGRARTIATSIEAMEYAVRVVEVETGQVVDVRDDVASRSDELPGAVETGTQYVLQTRPDEYDDLADVLDQIIAEQDEFDDYLDHRDTALLRKQRVFLGVLIAIVALLATLRLIEV